MLIVRTDGVTEKTALTGLGTYLETTPPQPAIDQQQGSGQTGNAIQPDWLLEESIQKIGGPKLIRTGSEPAFPWTNLGGEGSCSQPATEK